MIFAALAVALTAATLLLAQRRSARLQRVPVRIRVRDRR